MNNRFVFDLDNTLIMTDELNNTSYNYALFKLGILPISEHTRITRTVVFAQYPNLTELQKNQIVKLKQDYFMDNIHSTKSNKSLIYLLKQKGAQYCVLWTSADKNRVCSLLRHYRIENNFISIIYSSKQIISDDILKMCNTLDCTPKQLFFFEDDENIVNNLRLLGQKVFVADSPKL